MKKLRKVLVIIILLIGNPDLIQLNGKPIRLCLEMKDTDLYNIKFE